MIRIIRRWGSAPAERGSATGQSCPDILELETGDFMVIGKSPGVPHISARDLIKHSASVGLDEQAVIVPRQCLLDAARELAKEA